MADTKISDMTGSFSLTGTESVPIVQVGNNFKTTTQDIADLVAESLVTRYIKTSLSSAQILALHASPITLVAAPGAGKLIVPLSAVYYYHFVSAAYATQTQLRLLLGASGVAIDTTTDNILAEVSNRLDVRSMSASGGGYSNTIVDSPNAALTITVPTANPTAGDSTVDVYIIYKIITL